MRAVPGARSLSDASPVEYLAGEDTAIIDGAGMGGTGDMDM